MDRKEVRIDNAKGCRSVLEALQLKGVDLAVNCAGMGRCGKCRVRFLQDPPAPSNTDRNRFSEKELREGFRMACTARPRDGMVIEIL